jgi:hypothetical protein
LPSANADVISSHHKHLECFWKLYQPVAFQLALETDPGTTLLAGGNKVHSGPPTSGPRKFAFAVAIPDPNNAERGDDHSTKFESYDNDGKVQYSPVLLHMIFVYYSAYLTVLMNRTKNANDLLKKQNTF